MMCNVVSYIVALMVPFSEPVIIVKKECWTQVKHTKTAIIYEVQEITEVIPLNMSHNSKYLYK